MTMRIWKMVRGIRRWLVDVFVELEEERGC